MLRIAAAFVAYDRFRTTEVRRLEGNEAGKLVRRIVGILAFSDSAEAHAGLSKLHSVGPTKLRYFPFLEEDVRRALNG